MFGKNLSTTLPGIGAILTAIGNIISGLATDPPSIDWMSNIVALMAGIGLIFAKSHNVTGGTVFQPTPAPVLAEKAVEIKEAKVDAAVHAAEIKAEIKASSKGGK